MRAPGGTVGMSWMALAAGPSTPAPTLPDRRAQLRPCERQAASRCDAKSTTLHACMRHACLRSPVLSRVQRMRLAWLPVRLASRLGGWRTHTAARPHAAAGGACPSSPSPSAAAAAASSSASSASSAGWLACSSGLRCCMMAAMSFFSLDPAGRHHPSSRVLARPSCAGVQQRDGGGGMAACSGLPPRTAGAPGWAPCRMWASAPVGTLTCMAARWAQPGCCTAARRGLQAPGHLTPPRGAASSLTPQCGSPVRSSWLPCRNIRKVGVTCTAAGRGGGGGGQQGRAAAGRAALRAGCCCEPWWCAAPVMHSSTARQQWQACLADRPPAP